jgi:hypothetical protein
VLTLDPRQIDAHAIAQLAASDDPQRLRDLQAVLENPHEVAGLRSLAALYIGSIGTPAAVNILIANARTQTGGVLARIVELLGRIGDRRALAAVREVAARAEHPLATRARFAASLIAHRLELVGDEPTAFREVSYLDPSDPRLVAISIRSADPREAAQVPARLTTRYDIELAERPAYEIVCGRRKDFFLLNRRLVGRAAAERLERIPAVIGLVCTRDPEADTYAVSAVVLTAPHRRDQVEIRAFGPNGQELFGASGHVRAGLLHFRLLSVTRRAARQVEIIGTFGPDGLSIVSARAAPFVRPKLQAAEGLGPGTEAPE